LIFCTVSENEKQLLDNKRPHPSGMIIPDRKVLVYASNVGAPSPAEAKAWREGLVNGRDWVGMGLLTWE
jgi:hypothetical protein